MNPGGGGGPARAQARILQEGQASLWVRRQPRRARLRSIRTLQEPANECQGAFPGCQTLADGPLPAFPASAASFPAGSTPQERLPTKRPSRLTLVKFHACFASGRRGRVALESVRMRRFLIELHPSESAGTAN